MFVKNELNYQNIMARKIKFFYSEFSASSRSWTQFEFSILRTNVWENKVQKTIKEKDLKTVNKHKWRQRAHNFKDVN